MSKSKRQSIIIIGLGLIVLAGIILYYALSMPKVSVPVQSTEQNYQQYTQSNADSNSVSSNESYSNYSELSDANTANDGYGSSANNDSVIADTSQDTAQVKYPLNLNTCTAEDLMTIDGIGEVKAAAIIEYRDYIGGYTDVEQIKNIKGIGDKVYAKVAPYLTI